MEDHTLKDTREFQRERKGAGPPHPHQLFCPRLSCE